MGGEKQNENDETLDQSVTGSETQSDFDMEAATAEISDDLFGQGEDVDTANQAAGEDDSSGAGHTDAGDPPQPSDADKDKQPEGGDPTAVAAEDNSTAVQEVGAPKTWTKEALETWATIPERAQQEILKREEDFLKGIQGYKAAADLGVAYSNVVQPYAPILAAEKIDPVQMFQSFAANHYLLSRGTDDQKLQLAANLLDHYKIPLGPLLDYIAESGSTVHKPIDPEVSALRKEIDELKNGNRQRQTAEQEAIQKQLRAEIDTFAADPAHPYFDELADDIQKLFASGQAANLQEAYDKALYLNPQTRQKELDRLTTEKLEAAKTEEAKRKEKVTKSTGDQLNVGQRSRNGTVPKGSMDDTLSETLAAITSRA